MRLGRRPTFSLLLFSIAGCAAIPQSRAPAPRIAEAPPPPVPVVRATEQPERLEFSFEGAMSQGGVVVGTAPSGTEALSFDGENVPLLDDGRFVIAFDRDAGRSATLVATLADGRVRRETLEVAPREWDIEHVNIARGTGGPSAAFQRIRAPELARINAARRVDADSNGWLQRFMWPVTGRISGVFGSQRIYRGDPGSYHSGVDIATGESGTPIVAPADGVVTLATEKPFSLEGNLLILDHGMGLNSAFLHLSRIDVREGDVVRRGQTIGAIGATGRATGPHLHWSMKWRDARIDPMLLTGPMTAGDPAQSVAGAR